MKIEIRDDRKIFAIQEEFHKSFPYLKIEFFSSPHKVGAASSRKEIVNPGKTLGECRVAHNKGEIAIVPEMTVADLEQGFRNVYGLSVQVFRKSGKIWLETTVTDNWTLKLQNNLGMELSNSNRSEGNEVAE